MHAFKYHRPSSVNDAAALAKGEAKLLAGGQSLVQAMKLRLSSPSDIIDLGAIKDLAGIKADGSGQATGQIDVEVRDSAVAHHANNGMLAVSDAGQARIQYKITRSSAANNGAFGAVASGVQAFMIVDGSSLTKNGTGLAQLNGSTVATYGNNGINFNTTNTSGTLTPIPLK